MKSREIRSRYLAFFEKRGHQVCRSDSLVPENDPTLLFTGAGMNQFKDQFLGRNITFRRATTCQKCIRLPDLENVGRTPSHHTFFEMLGNFSFGDYFKTEAIQWAQELLLNELKLDPQRLWYTVYTDDDEAAQLWTKVAGVPADRVFRYGEKDNFWPSEAPSKGPNGPCGPCSEIYFDFTPERGRPAEGPAIDGNRFVEIWNLVFTQFDRQDGGVLKPLPQRNIDTGAGFERIARVMQGGANNFDTDLFQPIIRRIAEAAGKSYGQDPLADVKMRRIADHVRAVTFCIADGVRPSNEQRGYVVRKVLRRALMDWWNLGVREVGLETLVDAVVAVDGLADFYPALREHHERAKKLVAEEAAKFADVYAKGSAALAETIDELTREKRTVLDGKRAFFLWDTVGFPLDLTRRTLEERGLALDEDGYRAAMEAQRKKSQLGTNLKGEIFDTGPVARLKEAGVPASAFVGYDGLLAETDVLGIIRGDEVLAEVAASDDPDEERPRVHLVLRATPFYPEGGGQVGDRGEIAGSTGKGLVHETRRVGQFVLHETELLQGVLRRGERVRARVFEEHRLPTMRNHTATHLVHWALRVVLGNEVEQRGSLVEPERLRFDFTFPKAVPREQLARVERLVNEQVLKNLPVTKEEKSLDEAKKGGAMALFGEKYGERVRVVTVMDGEASRRSVELCGGTHCQRTGDIGAFKIVSESSIAAGVRRIEAITGLAVLDELERLRGELDATARVLKVDLDAVPAKVESLQAELKKLKKDLEKAAKSGAADRLQEIVAGAQHLDGASLYAASVDGLEPDALMGLADRLKQTAPGPAAIVLLAAVEGRVNVLVVLNQALADRGVAAGDLCREVAALVGGKGGGNPLLARGQGKDPKQIAAALERARMMLREKLKGAK